MKSIKLNYLYNTLLTLSNVLFPLITFPYVARVLGPEGLGKVNLAFAISAYFILIVQVGIPVYGIKEISKTRNDRYKLSKTFSELFLINTMMMFISIIAFIVIFLSSSTLKEEEILYFIAGISIFLSLFSIDWVFSGLEEYKFIAIRSITVKLISVILLFIFVQDASDYILYAFVTVFAILLTNFLNVIAVRKHIDLRFKNLNFKKHKKPILALFFAGIIGSIYQKVDIILLGNLVGEKFVGYYSLVRNITGIIIALIGSLGTVLIPRMSFYLDKKMTEEYNELAKKSLNFLYFLSFPAIIFIIFMSDEILYLLGGREFLEASFSLSIASFHILFTSLATFFGFQVVLAHNDEKSMLKANFFGAIVNITLNLVLIKNLYHNSTSISIVASELVVFSFLFYYSKKYTSFKLFTLDSIKYLKGSILLIVLLVIIDDLIKVNYIINLIVSGLLSLLIYFGYLGLKKDEFTYLIFKKFGRQKQIE